VRRAVLRTHKQRPARPLQTDASPDCQLSYRQGDVIRLEEVFEDLSKNGGVALGKGLRARYASEYDMGGAWPPHVRGWSSRAAWVAYRRGASGRRLAGVKPSDAGASVMISATVWAVTGRRSTRGAVEACDALHDGEHARVRGAGQGGLPDTAGARSPPPGGGSWRTHQRREA
jgi:hypothetical protein